MTEFQIRMNVKADGKKHSSVILLEENDLKTNFDLYFDFAKEEMRTQLFKEE